jgi:hypothetical protein
MRYNKVMFVTILVGVTLLQVNQNPAKQKKHFRFLFHGVVPR